MTKKTGGLGGDQRDQSPEEATSEFTELRTLLVELHASTQSTIQQQSDALTTAIGALTTRLDALTTALITRLEPLGQPVNNAPLQPIHQQQQQRPQQQLPPIHHPPRQNQQRFPHQFPPGDVRARNIFEEEEEEDHRRVFREDFRQHENNRWENSFKVDIPEFHGGLKGDDLIDWLVSVEEILDFKQVPPTRRVPLVAMRFRGHAATWWKQLKTTRSRTGKTPIQSWDKLLKHLRQTFLPHNYERTMYTKLQNRR